jgi:hypothetical protein
MPNLSQFYPTELNSNLLVYTTGSQTISGVKNFTSRPQTNGSGVLLQGEVNNILVDFSTVVYTTGNQTISGTKNFTTRPNVNGSGVVLQGEILENLFNGNRSITRVPVVNTNYGGSTISGFLENMFFGFVDANIFLSGFLTTGNSNIFEYGLNYTGFRANVTVNKNSNNNARNLIIFQSDNTPLNLPISSLSDGTGSYLVSNIIINESQNNLYGRIETGIVPGEYLNSNTANIIFSAPYFYGTNSSILNSNQIQSLLSKRVITQPTLNVNNPVVENYNPSGPEYAYFVYPYLGTYSWLSNALINGHIASILDQNNLENISLFTFTSPITLNFPNGKSATYRMARTINPINIPFTFKFYFYT